MILLNNFIIDILRTSLIFVFKKTGLIINAVVNFVK